MLWNAYTITQGAISMIARIVLFGSKILRSQKKQAFMPATIAIPAKGQADQLTEPVILKKNLRKLSVKQLS